MGRCSLADCPTCLADYGPTARYGQGHGTLGSMTAHQLTLPLEESATQYQLQHYIDGEPSGDPMLGTGSFDEATIARAEVIRTQQAFQEAGISKSLITWEDQARATGWFGVEQRDGLTHVHELSIVKA